MIGMPRDGRKGRVVRAGKPQNLFRVLKKDDSVRVSSDTTVANSEFRQKELEVDNVASRTFDHPIHLHLRFHHIDGHNVAANFHRGPSPGESRGYFTRCDHVRRVHQGWQLQHRNGCCRSIPSHQHR